MSATIRRLLMAGTATMASTGAAHAQSTGTAAGTQVSNTAQASYTVNGTAQTAASNTATFLVDRKVNLTVIADQAANTQANLGQTAAVARFKVTNNTNGVQDFRLTATQALSLGILPGVDNFDVTNLRIFVDGNGNGTYEAGTDTLGYIDELAPDASIEVFIVADVPASGTPTPDLAFVGLDVAVAAGGAAGTQGAILVADAINRDTEIDVVFADNDNDGTLGADTARNGQGWAYAAYEVGVRNVALSVTKTQTVLSDGVNTVNPKALPGAVVQYCLTVANATLTTPASGVSLTDVIPANTTYVPGSITVGGLGVAGQCVLNGFPQNDDGSQAAGPYTGSFNTTTKTMTATIPLLLGGTSVAASFRVTIN